MTEKIMQLLDESTKKLGIPLSSSQLEQFQTYYNELADWNSRFNLTAIIDIYDVQVKHFLDSLTVIKVINIEAIDGTRFIDVGTGAGFPGIPLKIAMPDIEMTLLEATAKKSVFLSHVIDKLGLADIEVITSRAEDAAQKPEYREGFDVVLSRAVADLSILSEFTVPFCKIGGSIIAQKKGDIQLELERAVSAIEKLGGTLSRVEKIVLEGLNDERYLVVIDKIRATPEKYPRRPGMPEKRPIM